ncbi:TlpA disulfide reductase family protein [uncultured Psychroserpens sp.]|uniref:TlpA disulfide reductase family protein n=1 Tax=uncultured Psychroserpens sp. TaxID=255436 RepID=UPI002602FA35|nr:TlpA disulfide reductase family protein [uncultured Psychroserpens sp.]
MKIQVIYLFICICLVSCKKENSTADVLVKKEGYTIIGNALGMYNGTRTYLKSLDEKGRLVNRDTAIIMNEAFVFDGKVDSPEIWYLYVNSIDFPLSLVIENAALSIELDKGEIKHSKVLGTDFNNAITNYYSELKALNDTLETTSKLYRDHLINKKIVAGMTEQIIQFKEQIAYHPHQFIKDNPKNPFSILLLDQMLRRGDINHEHMVTSFDYIQSDLKQTTLGKKVSKRMPEIKKQYDKIIATNIGKIAPDFSGLTPRGRTLKLSDVKGRVTIIDFWASWSKPCRIENPKTVKIYNKYHDKGLEIIGVSLDGNRNQKNPKSDWINAIKEDGLNWNHVSSLSYYNDPIVNDYNIKSIPTTIILDQEGKIVAKNLKGKALALKIEELLNL